MKDIYANITERFIEQLKNGTIPWQKPWSGAQNIVSQKQYRGINALILGSTDYGSPYWMTFKQCSDLGGRITKGEKSLPVVYYKFFDKRDEDGNVVYQDNGQPAKAAFIRWSNVFNLTQTNGIEAPKQTEARTHAENLDRAAAIVANANICPIKYTGYQALYSPRRDEIRIPPPDTFSNREEFFHTIFHELSHSTGHESRLNREGVANRVRFGSERYSKEELIAELGAAFLSNEAGILNEVVFENSAAYLQSWIAKLQEDHRLIISAASAAQRSSDLILGIEQKESVTTDDLSPSIEQERASLSIRRSEKEESKEAVLAKERPESRYIPPAKRGISI